MSDTLNIAEYIKKHKPMLRASSIKNYILQIKKFKKTYNIEGYFDFVRKPKTILKQLRKMKMAKNTEKNYTSAIINVITALNKEKIDGFTTKRFDNFIIIYKFKSIFLT